MLVVVVVVVVGRWFTDADVESRATDDNDDGGAPGSVWVRTLTTSRGVTIRDVKMEPMEPETILAVNADLLQ